MNAIGFALLSAVAASATAILAKLGLAGASSGLVTALRSVVVVVVVVAVAAAGGELRTLPQVPLRTLGLIGLSGLATAASWLAYHRALQLGPASLVAPIDKLSLALTVLVAMVVFHEVPTARQLGGVALIVVGTLLLIR